MNRTPEISARQRELDAIAPPAKSAAPAAPVVAEEYVVAPAPVVQVEAPAPVVEAVPAKPAVKPMNPLFKAAVKYANAGIPVHPLHPGAKAPMFDEWQKLATTDVAQIKKWWTQYPDANVGLHTVGLLVADVDMDPAKNKKGAESLAELQEEHEWPNTYTVRTPTGGFHMYYALPEGHPGVKNGKLAKDIDVRSTNGNLVGCGSRTEKGEYEAVGAATVIADAPQWMIDSLSEAATVDYDVSMPKYDPTLYEWPENLPQSARDWFEGKSVETDRSSALFLAVKDLYRCIHSEDRDSHVLSLLAGNAHTMAYATEKKHGNAKQALNYLWKYNCLKARVNHDMPAFDPDTPVEYPAKSFAEALGVQPVAREAPASVGKPDGAASEPRTKGPKTLRFRDIQTHEVWQDDYIIEGWLWRGQDAQLFGRTNIGKTFVSFNMCFHVAAGIAWWGCDVTQTGVLYLAYEGLQGIPKRMAALRKQMSKAHPHVDWNKIPFDVEPMKHPLVDAKAANQMDIPGRKDLVAAIKAFKEEYGVYPGLILIDTYSAALGGDASNEDLATKFNTMAQGLIQDLGATVLRIHHPGHTNQERARGSSVVGNAADADIRVTDGVIEATKQRDSAKSRLGFALEVMPLGKNQKGKLVTSCVVVPAPLANTGPALTDQQRSVLRLVEEAAGGAKVVDRKSVREAAAGVGIDAKKVNNTLADLAEKKVVRLTPTTVELVELGASKQFVYEEDMPATIH